ncbi:MAG: Fic family protein [Actinomycetaceae bacterium]|nr:Fic family protein [Actinomycetaceae bacterium]
MGTLTAAKWEPNLSLPGRANQQGGIYYYYTPDRLADLQIKIDPELSSYIAQTERRVRQLIDADGATELRDLSRFLLRSEAIASSQIEGIVPAAKQIALAEIGEAEDIRGISEAARLVARNMTVVSEASKRLAQAEKVTSADLEALQTALLGDDTSSAGIRGVQNWIGTSNSHPLDADYVPPAPHLVPSLLEDLLEYLNGATHSSLIQAALIHAQFESIHPFTDGNGRVGRALIHTVLTRRGLTPSQILPVSLILATFKETYVEALSATRFEGDPNAPENASRIRDWIHLFTQAVDRAVTQAEEFRGSIIELQEEWNQKLDEYRASKGFTRALRSNSGVARILSRLPGTPVLTAKTAQQIYNLSAQNASEALTQLHEAGILSTRKISRGTTAYIAHDILDLVTLKERALASTQFDTRASKPVRQVPALPQN